MSEHRMTLQEYIQSRNYKRRLVGKSKSNEKQRLLFQNSSLPEQLRSSQGVDAKNIENIPKTNLIQEMSKEIEKLDESIEGFSLIHKKVQQAKEYARQFIVDDKAFVGFCKKMFEIQSIYRMELIEAYRYQLFKYKFDHQNTMDDNRKKILKQLNDNYMNSKFQYKKVILKQKNELTQNQKVVIQNLIQNSIKPPQNNNRKPNIDQLLSPRDLDGKTQQNTSTQKNTFSFFEKFLPVSLNMKPSTQQQPISKTIDTNIVSIASMNAQKIAIEQPIKQKVNTASKNVKQKNTKPDSDLSNIRPHGSKKAVFLQNSPNSQAARQYGISITSPIVKNNPEDDIKIHENSSMGITPSSNLKTSEKSNGLDVKNFFNLLLITSQKEVKGKQKENEADPSKIFKQKQDSRRRNLRELDSPKQRQKKWKSKDYLQVKRK